MDRQRKKLSDLLNLSMQVDAFQCDYMTEIASAAPLMACVRMQDSGSDGRPTAWKWDGHLLHYDFRFTAH